MRYVCVCVSIARIGICECLFQAFWDDFPSGRMDKKGFVRYYEEIKDENDRTSVLCEYEFSLKILVRSSECLNCSHVFAVFDRDHDGTIDFHEFLLAVAAGTPGDLDSHLKYVFDMSVEFVSSCEKFC